MLRCLGVEFLSLSSSCVAVFSICAAPFSIICSPQVVCMYKGWAFTALAPRPTVVYCAFHLRLITVLGYCGCVAVASFLGVPPPLQYCKVFYQRVGRQQFCKHQYRQQNTGNCFLCGPRRAKVGSHRKTIARKRSCKHASTTMGDSVFRGGLGLFYDCSPLVPIL
jgi:hypothetical protein